MAVTWSSASKAIRETFSLMRAGSWMRLRPPFQRRQNQAPATVAASTPAPRSAALRGSPLCTQSQPLKATRPTTPRTARARPSDPSVLPWEAGAEATGRCSTGRLVGELLVGLRPVGAEGTQQQAGHDALAGPQGGERPEQGDEGVGARIKKVVVAEGAQGHVLGSARPEGQAPGLLALGETQRILLIGELLDAGLGVVGGDLAAHYLAVAAAGEQGDTVAVAGQFKREGLGHGDRLEEVLDAEEGALARAGRGDGEEDRGPGVGFGERVESHGFVPFEF